MAEKKSSDCERLTLALYRRRGDDEQDAIIAWLDSLPKKEDGSYQREVLRKHMMRAMYQYVVHGAPKYPLNVQSLPLQQRVETPVVKKSMVQNFDVQPEIVDQKHEESDLLDDVPVLLDVAEPQREDPPRVPGQIKLRANLSKKIAGSLHQGT